MTDLSHLQVYHGRYGDGGNGCKKMSVQVFCLLDRDGGGWSVLVEF